MDDVEQTGALHQLGNGLDFLQSLWSLNERHVGTGRQRCIHTAHSRIKPLDRTSVSPGDDYKLFRSARCCRCPDLCQIVVERNELLVIEVTATLRKDLILDVDRRHAGSFECLYRAEDIQLVSVTGIGIGNEGNVDGAGYAPRIVDHLGHREKAEVRVPERGGGARARHVKSIESGLRDKCRGHAVVGARRNKHRTAGKYITY